jgi:hypothetical protein
MAKKSTSNKIKIRIKSNYGIKKLSDFCDQVLPDFNKFLDDKLKAEIKQTTLRDAMLYL